MLQLAFLLLGMADGGGQHPALAAIRAALSEGKIDEQETQVELVTLTPSKLAAEGQFRFSWSQYPKAQFANARSVLLWPGEFRAVDGKTQPVWARVRVWRQVNRAVATRPIRAGRRIEAEDVKDSLVEIPPGVSTGDEPVESWIGRTLTRSVSAGTVLAPALLAKTYEINRGDIVRTRVEAGATRLSLEARAENSGQKGDPVTLVNPSSGRRFRATVTGPGEAIVRIE